MARASARAARRVQLGDREGLYDFDGVPLDAVQSATGDWPKMLDVARPARSSASSARRPPRRRPAAGTTIVVGGAITYFQRTVPDSSIRVTVSSNSVLW